MRGATLPILTNRVGDGGNKDEISVRRLQALLYHGGYLKATGLSKAANGRWDDKSRAALVTYLHKLPSSKDVYLEPNDPRLYPLLFTSPCTIFMRPGQQGANSFLAAQRFFKFPAVMPFRFPKGMLVWGVEGVPDQAIVTQTNSKKRPDWFLPIRAVLNCSTYVNLMMSVWRQGNCHAAPYTVDVHDSGRTSFARVHYGYPLLNDGKPLRGAVAIHLAIEKTGWDGLYCLQTSEGGGTSSVGHMALLHKLRVYECNYGGADVRPGYDGTVQDWDLPTWLQYRGALGCFVSGPSLP